MTVGIDFSIKSTAVTIIDKGIHFFYTFARKSIAHKDFFETLQTAGVTVVSLDDEPKLPKTANLTAKERSSTHDGILLTEAIARTLSIHNFSETDYIAIEGFSFASTGNRLSQISGYQWLLRSKLVKHCNVSVDQLYFFSPMTIKATAGKGNYKKEDMIREFIQSTDDNLKNSKFFVDVFNNPQKFQNKNGGWKKPIDDICDSYWIAKTLEKTLL